MQPVFPTDWKELSARRLFRDVVYDIHMQRVGKGNAVEITVDGKKIDGNTIPLPPKGTKTVKVEVLVGSK
jgi:cellobiose phosphorylase